MIIDSNILIYAINSDSPKNKKAQEFLRENLKNLEVTHQNILETLRVLTHPKFSKKMKSQDALESITGIIRVARIIQPRYETYYVFLELLKKHQFGGDKIFDIYLIATALSNNIETIATDNTKDFIKFKEIKTINPF
ncbi:MAG: PIN domain-containing protein [Candidatus Daviesbacteria bacterium]|nr:PIN domain-containing protein [Candidatus Daviesbacteria bacterium]